MNLSPRHPAVSTAKTKVTPRRDAHIDMAGVSEAQPHRPSALQRGLSVLYYMLSSVLIQSSNKALFTIWGFHYPMLVALLQMLVSTVVCYVIARPQLSARTALQVLPLAVVNVLNVAAGLMGTAGLTIPMFIALRRFTLVTTITFEFLLYRKVHDAQTLAAVGIMVCGGLIAALNDLNFNLYGYLAVFCNDVCTSLYLVFMKNINHSLTATGLLFYNSLISLPFLFGSVSLLYPERSWWDYPKLHYFGFHVVLISSCCLGLTINHSTFVCTRLNDPLTTHVAGNFKNILMTLLGTVAFGDFVFHHWLLVGLGISLCGSVYYASVKVRGMMTKTECASPPTDKPA